MGKFDGYLICTDLDGTLLRGDQTVSPENREAIEYFKAEGGLFTFVTGRLPYYAVKTYELVRPNCPIGCINGGGVYDYVEGRYIWNQELDMAAVELVRMIDASFPNVGIQMACFEKTYFSKDNDTLVRFRELTKLPNLYAPYDAIPDPVGKVIFGSFHDEEIRAVEKALRSHPLAKDFDFVRSDATLFEILPKGIGKGNAIKKLVEHLGINPDKTIAVGDYNNDISMFRAVKMGVAVANACPEALEAADMVTVSNEEHAIARIIYDLEEGKLL